MAKQLTFEYVCKFKNELIKTFHLNLERDLLSSQVDGRHDPHYGLC